MASAFSVVGLISGFLVRSSCSAIRCELRGPPRKPIGISSHPGGSTGPDTFCSPWASSGRSLERACDARASMPVGTVKRA